MKTIFVFFCFFLHFFHSGTARISQSLSTQRTNLTGAIRARDPTRPCPGARSRWRPPRSRYFSRTTEGRISNTLDSLNPIMSTEKHLLQWTCALQVCADASLVFPLLVAETFARIPRDSFSAAPLATKTLPNWSKDSTPEFLDDERGRFRWDFLFTVVKAWFFPCPNRTQLDFFSDFFFWFFFLKILSDTKMTSVFVSFYGSYVGSLFDLTKLLLSSSHVHNTVEMWSLSALRWLCVLAAWGNKP